MVDYRRMLLICLMPQILAGGGMQLEDGARQLVNERLDRVVAAIEDLDAGELMP